MVASVYGRWEEGSETPLAAFNEDKIVSSAAGASQTRYGITVLGRLHPFTGGWELRGGLVGQIKTERMVIQLFGKEVVRTHGPGGTAMYGRDYSEEYFLVVRGRSGGSGHIVKRWHFPSEALALRIDPQLEESFRRSHPKEEALKLIDQNKSHRVAAYVSLDGARRVATVRVDGLTNPFEERVDLSMWLQGF